MHQISITEGEFTFTMTDGVTQLVQKQTIHLGLKIQMHSEIGRWGRNDWCVALHYISGSNHAVAAFRASIPRDERKMAIAREYNDIMENE